MNKIMSQTDRFGQQLQPHNPDRVAGELRFKFAVNSSGCNKDWDFEKLATEYRDVEGTLADVIEHVMQGHAIAAGCFGGKRRCKANVTGTHWILGDIDNSKVVDGEKAYDPQLTIEQALEHPFIKKYCSLIYTSSSHTPDWHRFRLVFMLPEFVEGWEEIEQIVRFMMAELPFLDPSCKDASRVFYGNTDAEFPLFNPNAVLPSEWVQEAKEQARLERIAYQARCEEIQRRKERYPQDSQDTDALVMQALSYIPPRQPGSNNYEECTKVAMALVSHFGEMEAERIIEQWSLSIPGSTWNVAKKVRSYKRDGVSIGTLFYIAKSYGFKFPEKKIPVRAIDSNLNKDRSVTGDSDTSGDSQDVYPLGVSATVTSVTAILNNGFPDYEEQHRLDAVELKSGMSPSAFRQLVSKCRFELDAVTKVDEMRLDNLINWHQSSLDFDRALPKRFAREIQLDAKSNNIEPIVIWQPLMSAIHSICGAKVEVDLGTFKVPSVSYTLTVLESGGGKSRADNLVFAPIRKRQAKERKRFLEAKKAWEGWKKDDGDRPELPREKKLLFDVATIQSVLRRISEQPGDRGQVWSRDEIAGLFKSLGQFSKGGENEGTEILLKAWDGQQIQTDRVCQDDSFFVEKMALSINGGIQPGYFRNIFKDPNDSQGLLARFLIATPKMRKPTFSDGAYCHLSDTLPDFYDWLEDVPATTIKLSPAARQFYKHIYNEIGKQAFEEGQPAIRAWMMKLTTQVIRIAIAIHAIECFESQGKPFDVMDKSTIERAVLFAQYYRSAFHVVQEVTTSSDDMSSILLKVWDLAQSRFPDGITPRDAYRAIKAIGHKAKETGRSPNAYTLDLFHKLEQLGKGRVLKNGRTVKFISETTSVATGDTRMTDQESAEPVTLVTLAEITTQQEIQLSPEVSLSPVTLPTNENSPSVIDNNQDITSGVVSTTNKDGLNLSNSGNSTDVLPPGEPLDFGVEEAATPQDTAPVKTDGFKVGDRVASNDPELSSYHWKGTITKMNPNNPEICYVDYPERKALKLKETEITARLENLRHIEAI